MPIRLALIPLLLLVVFLNTTVGAWVHESLHLAEQAHTAAAAGSVAQQEPGHAEPEDDRTLHRTCAWCVAQNHHALIGTWPPAFAAPPLASTVSRLSRSAVPRPDPERWPFAARDPPRILG